MTIISIDRYRPSRRAISAAVATLRSGGAVVFPTETSYGLAVDPGNAEAVTKAYAIKSRERGKPLPLIAGSFAHARRIGTFSAAAAFAARKFWPGPLSFVLPARAGLPAAAGSKEIVIRVPAAASARALALAFGGAITSTSANVSGDEPLFSGDAVRRAFSSRKIRPDLLLDAGTLPLRPPSTIVRLRRGKIVVLREGAVKGSELLM